MEVIENFRGHRLQSSWGKEGQLWSQDSLCFIRGEKQHDLHFITFPRNGGHTSVPPNSYYMLCDLSKCDSPGLQLGSLCNMI